MRLVNHTGRLKAGHPKAPLDPAVATLPDVTAYIARLHVLVTSWIAASARRRIVCTVKFQGDIAYAAIPGGRLMRLAHNKFESNFAWAREGYLPPQNG